MIVKRHMKDEHIGKTDSISPPTKKQKKTDDDVSDEPMDIDDKEPDRFVM